MLLYKGPSEMYEVVDLFINNAVACLEVQDNKTVYKPSIQTSILIHKKKTKTGNCK